MKKGLIGLVTAGLLASGVWGETLATVNGKSVSEEDIATILKTMPGVDYRRMNDDQKKKILDQAVERVLLMNEAKKSGVEKQQGFKDALARMKDDLVLEYWMKEQFDKVSVSNAEIKAFYDKNKERFVSPERVKARHILLKTEEEATAVIKELQKSSNIQTKFIELAEKKSTGPSASKGGDLGWFGKGQMVPAFSEEAFGLSKGTHSKKPVKTRFGYHVVYVEDKKDGGTLELEQVQRGIEQELKMQKFKDEVSAEAQKLKSKAKITYN